jgi:rieske iron-sulfur protein
MTEDPTDPETTVASDDDRPDSKTTAETGDDRTYPKTTAETGDDRPDESTECERETGSTCEVSREALLGRSYPQSGQGDDSNDAPGTDSTGAPGTDSTDAPETDSTDVPETDALVFEDESSACDACPGGDGSSVEPSIYEPFWRDARARLRRRDYAKVLATLGGITALGSLVAPVAGLTQVFDRKYKGPVYSDGVALVDENGNPIREGTLSTGEHLTVFPAPRPGIEDAPTLLVRFEEDAYGDGIKTEFTVGGYAAFSKVCTHAGCMVADRDGDVLVCPCHSGRFDPLTGASVVGGPPPRELPQLPITLTSDGALVATGDFDGPVGPGGE